MDRGDLTSKEFEVLAMIAQGHDAKSAARELDVSCATIYQRLKRARAKMGVNSSREAARMMFAHDVSSNQKLVYEKLILPEVASTTPQCLLPDAGSAHLVNQIPDDSVSDQTHSFWNKVASNLPLRAEGERDIHVSKVERLRLIGDLSTRLAMAFVAICLAAMVLTNLFGRV